MKSIQVRFCWNGTVSAACDFNSMTERVRTFVALSERLYARSIWVCTNIRDKNTNTSAEKNRTTKVVSEFVYDCVRELEQTNDIT